MLGFSSSFSRVNRLIKKLATYGLLLSESSSNLVGVEATLPSVINVSNLNSTTGRIILGAPTGFGDNIVALPDISGDGLPDVGYGPYSSSVQYIIFGSDNLPFFTNVSDLNGTNGFVIPGIQAGDQTGKSLVALDITGDQKPELFVGSSYGGPNSEGTVDCISGRDVWPAVYDRTSNQRTVFHGSTTGSYFGGDMIIVPDQNGNGISEIIVSAALANTTSGINSGEIYGLFSDARWINASTNFYVASNITNVTGFKFQGAAPADYAGTFLQYLGDMNNDTHWDIGISSIGASYQNRSLDGAFSIVYGNHSFAGMNLSAINGRNGVTYVGENALDGFGRAFSMDVNRDRKLDLVMSTASAENNRGVVYIQFGPITETNPKSDLRNFNNVLGVRVYGKNSGDQLSRITACDMDGDGFLDLVLASPYANGNRGEVYIFSANTTWPSIIYLNSTNPWWITVHGESAASNFGYSMSCTRNFACGGPDELLISAPRGGKAYVICGEASTMSPSSASSSSQTSFSNSNSISVATNTNSSSDQIASSTAAPTTVTSNTNVPSTTNQNPSTSTIPIVQVLVFSITTESILFSSAEGLQLTTNIFSITNLGNIDPSRVILTLSGENTGIHIFVGNQETNLFTYAQLVAGSVNLEVDTRCQAQYQLNLQASIEGTNNAPVDVSAIFDVTDTSCADGSSKQLNRGLLVSSFGLFSSSHQRASFNERPQQIEKIPGMVRR